MVRQAHHERLGSAPSALESEISDNAKVVLEKRYYLKDSQGNTIEHSWTDVCRRVARAIAEKNTYNIEHKVNRVDGTVGWALSRAVPLFDEHGNIMFVESAVQNLVLKVQNLVESAVQHHVR